MVYANKSFTATADAPIVLECPRGFSKISVQCSAHTAGSSAVQVSNDKTNWSAIVLIPVGSVDIITDGITSIVAAGMWYNHLVFARFIRIIKTGNGAQTLWIAVDESTV